MISRWLPVVVLLFAQNVAATTTTTTASTTTATTYSPALANINQPTTCTSSDLDNIACNQGAKQAASSRLEAEATKATISETTAAEFLQAEANKRRKQQQAKSTSSAKRVYTNQFVIEVKGGEQEARRLADKHGFIYLNHIVDDYYHLEHRRLARRSTLSTLDMAELDVSIEEEPQVLKLERQVLKRRVKRDFIIHGQQQQPAAASQVSSPFSSPPASVHHQRNQQQQQLLRPSSSAGVGRPAQFMRPANQAPSSASWRASQPPPAPLGRQQWPANAAAQRARPNGEQQQAAASGPVPFFMHAGPGQQQHSPAQTAAPFGNQSFARHPFAPTASANNNNNNNNASSRAAPFNDPSWPLMWYLDGGARDGFDLNVQAAWKMGYTGKGIVITILDDGLEKDHPDLQANYDPLASFDINSDDADPMPRYDIGDSNRHGTRCAGEIAAVPDNNICTIGIAYNSKVGGVRMLDGDVTDAVEARSLGLNNQHIHIYSASWGPDDNGKTVDGPGELATRAFIDGVTNGRQGLGSIFVFASGNGGREHDNCNCDGYTNSIWTLSISSASENGYVPWYIEACSSTLATTYSSGAYDERQIATTDIRHTCTSNHTGTSASAPIAAAICALVLESNPRLTWRDMQHIVVRTAKPANLIAKDWRTNALGRNVSHAFGYGLMDAAAMIMMAKKWTTVPVQYTCEVRSPKMEKIIPAKGYIELKLGAECANVRYLEHVQSRVTLTAGRRGDLHIYLTSPHGTRSTLLAQRPNDSAEQGFRSWPFMTVHSWGESPNGVWTLEVYNDGKPTNRAYLKEWTLILYGTYDDPNKHLNPSSFASSHTTTASSSISVPSEHSNRQQQSSFVANHRGSSSSSSSSSLPSSTSSSSSSSSSATSSPASASRIFNGNQPIAPQQTTGAPSQPQTQSPQSHVPPGPVFAPAAHDQNSDLFVSKLSNANNNNSDSGGIGSNLNRKPTPPQQQIDGNQLSSYHMMVPTQMPPTLKRPTTVSPDGHSSTTTTGDGAGSAPSTTTSSSLATISSISTTSSSYVSTFKTVINNQPDNNNNTQHSANSDTFSTRPPLSPIITTDIIKPDFDIVAAPNRGSPNNQWQHITINLDTKNTTMSTGSVPEIGSNDSKQFINQQSSSVDKNRIDATSHSAKIDHQQQNEPNNKPTTEAPNHVDDEIGTNQLDSKLSKDYRSSGSGEKNQQHKQTGSQNSAANSSKILCKFNNPMLILQHMVTFSSLILLLVIKF